MDDNQFATSEQEDPHFAVEVDETPEVETQVDVPEAPTEVETAPETKEPAKQKTLREELEAALSPKEEVVEAKPEEQVEVKPEEPAAPKMNPPAAWRAEAREMFDGIPDAIKEEVLRREKEISTTLAQTGDERKLAQAFMQAAQQYEPIYRQQGTNSLAKAAELFGVDHVLQNGSMKEKANIAARIIQHYGIDIDELSDHIVTIQSQPQQQQVPPEYQQRLAQLEQHTYQQQQQYVEQQRNAVNNTIDEFASNPKNEFFNDVAQHMVGLLQAGTAKDLQEAYEQACHANPSVRKIIAQRAAAFRQRAAAGTASLPAKGPRNGAKPIAKQQGSARDAITAAWDSLEGGRV